MTTDRCSDDDEVVAAASARGWRVVEQPVAATSVWRWMRFTDEIWPTFRSRPSAVAWMRSRLNGERSEASCENREHLIAAGKLERAIADRATQVPGRVDAAELFMASEQRPERLAFETRTINRALKHGLVLYANSVSNSELIFSWRSRSERIGPRFDDRALAINWIAEWLANNVE